MTNNVRESTAPSKTPYPMAPIGKNGSPSQESPSRNRLHTHFLYHKLHTFAFSTLWVNTCMCTIQIPIMITCILLIFLPHYVVSPSCCGTAMYCGACWICSSSSPRQQQRAAFRRSGSIQSSPPSSCWPSWTPRRPERWALRTPRC